MPSSGETIRRPSRFRIVAVAIDGLVGRPRAAVVHHQVDGAVLDRVLQLLGLLLGLRLVLRLRRELQARSGRHMPHARRPWPDPAARDCERA